ncbi:MAG: 4Fe-4S binding protein [Anaerotignaceae bacterium]
MTKNKKIAKVSNLCVACGTCINVCPFNAISINHGIKAKIDLSKCVGCGKCSKICPASIIEIVACEVENGK